VRARTIAVTVTLIGGLVANAACSKNNDGFANGGNNGQPAATATTPTPGEQKTPAQPAPAASSASASSASAVVVVEIGDEALPKADPKRTGFRSGQGTPRDDYSARAYGMDVVNIKEKGTNAFWSAYLNTKQPRLHEQTIGFRFVAGNENYAATCTPGQRYGALSERAYFCSADSSGNNAGLLYLPGATYFDIWKGGATTEQANFVGALVVASVYSHYLVYAFESQLKLPTPSASAAQKLIACFTGIWVRGVYPGSEVKPAAIDAALLIIQQRVGFPLAPGESAPSIIDMKTAFDAGFQDGKVGSCVNSFWSGVTWK
jgi:hypothetical protein